MDCIKSPRSRFFRRLDLAIEKDLQKFCARACCIYVTWEWHLFSSRSDNPESRFTLPVLAEQIPKLFLIYSFGLWLSTTKWGEYHPKLTAFLMVPSLFVTSPMVGYQNPFGGWIVLFIVAWTYGHIFYMRRKNTDEVVASELDG